MRNALAHVSRGQHTVIAAAIRQAFDQPDRAHAGETWRKVSEQLRPRWPKLADLMDASEHDVLAYMSFPRQHRTKLHSTNPIERLNKMGYSARSRSCLDRLEELGDPSGGHWTGGMLRCCLPDWMCHRRVSRCA
jgi:transposase-like protein